MGWNLPDDYGMHWRTCPKHKTRYHASDGGCDSCIAESEPSAQDLTDGYMYVYLNSEGKIEMSPSKEHYEYGVVVPPGKWLMWTSAEGDRLIGGMPYDPETMTPQDGDIMVEVPPYEGN